MIFQFFMEAIDVLAADPLSPKSAASKKTSPKSDLKSFHVSKLQQGDTKTENLLNLNQDFINLDLLFI
jgi:hypothetical protein